MSATLLKSQEKKSKNLTGNMMQVHFSSHDILPSRSQDAQVATKPIESTIQDKPRNGENPYRESALEVVSAVFKKQPPDNLRKSNFFHFDLSFSDTYGSVVTVEKSNFTGFLEDKETEKPLRNGIIYKMMFTLSTGKKISENLLVRLIDSYSKKPISYDGQDKNPDMCRVLLTHEVMCSRCCENKSCGNRNETPSDPVVMNGGLVARYHMKCNQNCLKNAGNPRETRRFQVMVAFIRQEDTLQLATSENMFVHNNSKHGRRPTALCDSLISSGSSDITKVPILHQVIPKEGKLSGFDELAILGDNFFEGLQIAFGNQIAFRVEVISSNIIRVLSPPCNGPLMIEIKCVHSNKVFQRGMPLQFRYANETYDNQLEFYLERLWALLPKQPTDMERPSKDIVLRRSVELLECMYVNGSLIYGPYENGHHAPTNLTNVFSHNSTNIHNMPNGKDSKSNIMVKVSSSDGLMEATMNGNDYIRHAMVTNGHQNYDNVNNQSYIMGPLLMGVNQICDTVNPNNQSNFYVPYQAPPCDQTHHMAMDVSFPCKRQFPGVQ